MLSAGLDKELLISAELTIKAFRMLQSSFELYKMKNKMYQFPHKDWAPQLFFFDNNQ